MKKNGWQVVAVPGLVPDDVFFDHLANRRFPAGHFIRKSHELDYLEEPDVFHDVFGHVPMLMNPVIADYIQAYGEGGLKAKNLGVLDKLARVYWYTVAMSIENKTVLNHRCRWQSGACRGSNICRSGRATCLGRPSYERPAGGFF